jgi:ABC-2 type transport system permease protein
MNVVIMRLTLRGLLGGKRALLLLLLPALLLLVAGLTRWGSGGNPDATSAMAANFAMGTLLPLMCLLIGTGAIGPEIEDGSIVYLLAKPLPRRTVALSKLTVAITASLVLGTISTVAAILIAGDQGWWLTNAYATSVALAAIGYTAIFFMLAIVSRSAVIVGLIYALLWEGVLGGYVPGIRVLSVRQWALSAAERVLDGQPGLMPHSEVSLTTGLIMLAITTVVVTVLGVRKLKTLPMRVAE